jgi:hypothetical protein|tara:strand:- start:32 stop:193 length:162 start_codon:yes stop_codon:yes gene_type:complete
VKAGAEETVLVLSTKLLSGWVRFERNLFSVYLVKNNSKHFELADWRIYGADGK